MYEKVLILNQLKPKNYLILLNALSAVVICGQSHSFFGL